MSSVRRPQLARRRRRTIYANHLEETNVQGRRAAALREARRPAVAYGARVHRRVRARWFGLVPVRRRSMTLVTTVLVTGTLALGMAHHLATTWSPLTHNQDLARPFLLDRPDSLGTWLTTLLLASAAIVSLMIYQLRRHRLDDYKGHYRLWRPTILLLLIVSLDSVAGFAQWLGSLLNFALAHRTAVSGSDWIHLLLVIGGTTFAMRLIAEIRDSKLATLGLIMTVALCAFPCAVHWKTITLSSPWSATLLATSPLLATTSLWISLVAYLRMLYRNVRDIDQQDSQDGLFSQIRTRLRAKRTPSSANIRTVTDTQPIPAKRKVSSQTKPSVKQQSVKTASSAGNTKSTRSEKPLNKTQVDAPTAEGKAVQQKRRWLGLRKGPKPATEIASPENGSSAEKPSPPIPSSKQTRPTSKQPLPSKNTAPSSSTKNPPTQPAPASEPTTDTLPDSQSIDGTPLTKSQRRRLKRQLKRQNKAA